MRRRCGPARNATSCIIRCRAGRCSTSSSPITTTRPSRSPESRCPTTKSCRGSGMCIARAQDIIRHGRNWRLWVLCDRDPVERWVDGRVTLLGDAAHPMMQYFAQGACMALEDAVCLSHMLAAHPDDHAAALERYRVQRFRAHRAGATAIARHRRAHLPPVRRTRPAPQRHHARKDLGGLLPRPRLALWRHGAEGMRGLAISSFRGRCAEQHRTRNLYSGLRQEAHPGMTKEELALPAPGMTE